MLYRFPLCCSIYPFPFYTFWGNRIVSYITTRFTYSTWWCIITTACISIFDTSGYSSLLRITYSRFYFWGGLSFFIITQITNSFYLFPFFISFCTFGFTFFSNFYCTFAIFLILILIVTRFEIFFTPGDSFPFFLCYIYIFNMFIYVCLTIWITFSLC